MNYRIEFGRLDDHFSSWYSFCWYQASQRLPSGYTSLNSCQIKLNFNFSCNPFLAVCLSVCVCRCVKIHKHPFGKYMLNTTIYINDRFVHLFRNVKLNTVKWVHLKRAESWFNDAKWWMNFQLHFPPIVFPTIDEFIWNVV